VHKDSSRGRSGRTGRGTGGNDGTVEASLGDDVNLDGGVSTGVVDGAGEDLLDSHVDG
jgi:hypothetical protein